MPTYEYACPRCGATESVVQSISSYSRSPIRFMCCGEEMPRKLTVVPAMSGLANALAGDRHYEGLVAPDGTDIGSRTKHREYMRRHGLTTADDFKGVWQSAEKERKARLSGAADNALKAEVSEQVMRAVAQPD